MKIEELHDRLFEMWRMFDAICKQHGIVYFFDSGCLIGAAREHDFIPWDDDMDIAIMREDYIRLKPILQENLAPQYKLIEPNDYAPYFYDFIPRLIDTTVQLRNKTEEDRAYKNYQNCMSIDFVILDKVPDAKWKQSLIKLKCKYYYGLARSKRYSVKNEKLTWREKLLASLCALIGKKISLERLIQLYENNTTKYAALKTDSIIRSNSILYFIRFCKIIDYSEVVYLPFHGNYAPAPVGYDTILKQLYGDYMTPTKNYKGAQSHIENQDES